MTRSNIWLRHSIKSLSSIKISNNVTAKRPLGIIAGSGSLPLIVAKAHSAHSGGNVFIATLRGMPTSDHSPYESKEFAVGAVEPVFEYFRSHKVIDIVMIGGMQRPNFSSIKVDTTGAKLLGRILKSKLLGDDKLLRIIARFFEENNFRIVSAVSVLSGESTITPSVITDKSPSAADYKDIAFGFKAAKNLGAKDIGQSVIVQDRALIASEDEDGTDKMIARNGRKGALLVKVMKPIQDDRLDIPAIGINTVENAAKAGLSGIAIEADKVIVIEREKVIKKANELGIFIAGVEV